MGTADQCAARWLRRSRFALGSNRAVPSREQPLPAAQGTNRFMIAGQTGFAAERIFVHSENICYLAD
jgi:hypothetical protein